MDFSLILDTWPSEVHREIYWAARQITPAELSLAGMEGGSLRDGCEAYHAFVMDMLSDMYENPSAYALPAGALEAFLDGRKLNAVRRKQPAKVKAITAQTRNAVGGYMTLLCRLGKRGRLSQGALELSDGDLAEIARKSGGAASPIPLKTRLEALARVGLTIDEAGRFTSARHPGMLVGLSALADTVEADKMSSFRFFNFANCDFRAIAAPYMPTYEDYVRPLPPERRAVADMVDRIAKQMNVRPQITTFWKVYYKYRSVQIIKLSTDMGRLEVHITMAYNWDDREWIDARLSEESPEMRHQLLRHVAGCTACSSDHLGPFVTILGKRRRVCGGCAIAFRFVNPAPEDVAVIARCVELRARFIDDNKRKEGKIS